MDPRSLIPSPDPIPLPAPVGLLQFLLVFTFILHVIPMNILLGGTFIAPITEWMGRRGSANHLRLARQLAVWLPIAAAFTITLGVAPLLFIQVLYGQFFYTSSILMAWRWIALIPLLILGYLGVYGFALRKGKWEKHATVICLISALLFAKIGYLLTNNIVMMLKPELWWAAYTGPISGGALAADPIVIPRFLHVFVGAVAIGGLFTVAIGLHSRRSDNAYGDWVVRYGVLWFAVPTMCQFIVGPWFFQSLPSAIRSQFLGGNVAATVALGTGLLLALAGLAHLLFLFVSKRPAPLIIGGMACILGTITAMATVRHFLRQAYLAPYIQLHSLPTQPQTGIIALFAVLLVVVLGTIVWMLLRLSAQTPVGSQE